MTDQEIRIAMAELEAQLLAAAKERDAMQADLDEINEAIGSAEGHNAATPIRDLIAERDDYKQGAEIEAKLADEARAKIRGESIEINATETGGK